MAAHYRNTIADMIEKFDNSRLSRTVYEKISWAGLGEIENNKTTIAWDRLSLDEKKNISKLIQEHIFKGPSKCQ